jgi:hypothetical protein
MIIITSPSVSVDTYGNWNIYGYFNWANTDPGLTAKTFGYNYYAYQGFANGSAGTFTPNFTVNVTNAVSRLNFLNQIQGLLGTLTTVLGVLTVSSKTELYYGGDPINPALIKWEFLVKGTCSNAIPSNLLFISEYVLNASFNYEYPLNNNTCGLIYTI